MSTEFLRNISPPIRKYMLDNHPKDEEEVWSNISTKGCLEYIGMKDVRNDAVLEKMEAKNGGLWITSESGSWNS